MWLYALQSRLLTEIVCKIFLTPKQSAASGEAIREVPPHSNTLTHLRESKAHNNTEGRGAGNAVSSVFPLLTELANFILH